MDSSDFQSHDSQPVKQSGILCSFLLDMSASQIALNLISTRAWPWKSSGFDFKKMGTYGHKNHPKTAHISGCLTRFSTENPWPGHEEHPGWHRCGESPGQWSHCRRDQQGLPGEVVGSQWWRSWEVRFPALRNSENIFWFGTC